MHPHQHARTRPDHPALIVADTGATLSYRELDAASNRVAQLFREMGLRPGDRFGVLLRNCPEFSILFWAAQRSGLVAVLISTHLKPDEAAYVLNDSGARLLVTASDIGETAATIAARRGEIAPGLDAVFDIASPPLEGARDFHAAIAQMPATPVPDEISGLYLLYSSGTTGRPKGIVTPFVPGPIEAPSPVEGALPLYAAFDRLVSLSPGPMYHGAPLNGMILTQRLGGTAVTMRKFDAALALKAIDDWHVVHAQFVPTMFVRMLALPEAVRTRFDLSSLAYVLHAAAPCPVDIKRRMIEWLGPIVHEYYGASENLGGTFISAEEWLRKPGSVGRSQTGPIHICGEDGNVLPPAGEGLVYFELPPGRAFDYLNDPEKTSRARHPVHHNWYTVGDIGRVDEEGYLFLTDRRDFMIISGGVNIYPQAVENALIEHPKVLDAAVIGIPNPDFGEEVKAIVQPKAWADAGEALAAELIAWCREHISAISAPRSVDFVEALPRLASGKLAKRSLRDRYAMPERIDN